MDKLWSGDRAIDQVSNPTEGGNGARRVARSARDSQIPTRTGLGSSGSGSTRGAQSHNVGRIRMARGAVALIALVLLVYRPVWTAAWVFEDTETMNYTTRTVTTATWQIVRSPLGAHMLSLSLSFLLAALLLLFARRLGVRGIGLWLIA